MGHSKQADAALESVRSRIHRWRRSRVKRSAMPEELWSAAVALCEDRGIHPVAHRLQVSYDRLKLRVVETELERLRSEQACGELDDEEGLAVNFVPMLIAQSPTAPEVEGVDVQEVELLRPDGGRMTLRLGGQQELDLVELSRSFLGEAQ